METDRETEDSTSMRYLREMITLDSGTVGAEVRVEAVFSDLAFAPLLG